MYALLLLLTTIVCCVMLAPGLQDSLASVPFCKTHKSGLDSFSNNLDEAGNFLGAGDLGQEIGISGSSLKVRSLDSSQLRASIYKLQEHYNMNFADQQQFQFLTVV